MEPSIYSDDELLNLIQWHTVDTFVGLTGTLICLPTLAMLALLAFGDLLTCMGILAVGFMRKSMYLAAMETGRVPIETSWSCAWKPFVLLRLLGSIIPPGIVFWLSVERFLAVFGPMFFRNHITKHNNIPPAIILFYTFLSCFVAYSIAWTNRSNSDSAPFYCGRKVSFSVGYTSYLYIADIAGFVIAFILNCLTLFKLARLYAKRKNRFEVRKQLKRIRYMIVISLISTITVAVPNAVALFSAWFGKLHMYLAEPAVWMIVFKSSINFFVYLLLKTEYRQRIYEILGCLSSDNDPKNDDRVSFNYME